MTPVPVNTVRNVCVLLYPPMSMHVLLKVSYLRDGGTMHAVSKTQTVNFEMNGHLCFEHFNSK